MRSLTFSRGPARLLMVAAALLITIGLSACTESADDGNGGESASMQADETQQTIVDVAMNDDRFSTLVTALDSAGLVQTLQTGGPFTVFAPTNAAFNALPDGTLDQLLQPDNRDQLSAILTYHVVDSTYMASDVAGTSSLTTLEGSTLNISMSGDSVMVNEATVTATDIEASNGVIHVIDAVLQPPAEESM